MPTYKLDATVHESVDIALEGVTLGRYSGDVKEADLTPVYVDGGYNARNYTATDTPASATGKKWRWTATDIYGNTGSATVPEHRIQLSTDIVTCEDVRIVWDIDGTTVTNATVTISHNGTTVTSFSASGIKGKHILGGGLEPETTYNAVMTATVDGDNLTGSCTFTTTAVTDNWLCITNYSTNASPLVKVRGVCYGNCHVQLEYSFNGQNWHNWDDAYVDIGLGDYGSKVYIRGYGGSLSTSSSDYFQLAVTSQRTVEISGDANFLLSRNGGMIETPAYSFYRLFYGQMFEAVNLTFSGKILTGSCVFCETFRSSHITNCPTIGVVESYGPDAGTVFERTFCQSHITAFNPFTGYPKNISLDYTCQSCASLVSAVVRMNESTYDYALWRTFQDSGIQSAELHILSVGLDSMDSTFKGCTSLTSITLASDCGDFPNGFSSESNWLVNASSTGTLHKPTATQFPSSSLPVGWTISNDVTA